MAEFCSDINYVYIYIYIYIDIYKYICINKSNQFDFFENDQKKNYLIKFLIE